MNNLNGVLILEGADASLCRQRRSVLTDEEYSQMDCPFLGRGDCMNGFDCYTIEELVRSFESNRSSCGKIEFRDPHNYNRIFSVDTLREFRNALLKISISPEIIELFNGWIGECGETCINTQGISPDTIRQIWTSLFTAGMYMRRWRGPGFPYPKLDSECRGEPRRGTRAETKISSEITKEMFICTEALETLPHDRRGDIWNLPMMRSSDGEIVESNQRIYEMYNGVQRGDICIRVVSSKWIITGAYYLKRMLGEDTPGFSLDDRLDVIE